jgi:hypothetical protein
LSFSLGNLSNSRVTPPCSRERTLRLVRLKAVRSPKPWSEPMKWADN